ncbi:MAG TPA: substrate binding domain-containing protein, partial [Xanthomonadales bacterium]|nr:substrate binding domain-containing protein [Xanthomonadales bacterium]
AVASPAFVAGRTFASPASLVGVAAVHNSSFRDDPHWAFERDGRSESVSLAARLSVNSYRAIRQAALAGAGVVRLPLYMVRDELERGALVRVCAGWELVPTPLYVVYPQRRHQPLRTRVFLEFLLRWFEQPERKALLR